LGTSVTAYRKPPPVLLTVPCNNCAGHFFNLGENILLAISISPFMWELPLMKTDVDTVDIEIVEVVTSRSRFSRDFS
jgi:hypothetical protein